MCDKNLTCRVQALKLTNEKHQQKILRLNEDHQQVKYNQVQAIQFENVELQGQQDVYQAELQ